MEINDTDEKVTMNYYLNFFFLIKMKIQRKNTSPKNDSKKVATVTFDLTDLPFPGGRFFQIGTPFAQTLDPSIGTVTPTEIGYNITTLDIKPNESPITLEYSINDNPITDIMPTFCPIYFNYLMEFDDFPNMEPVVPFVMGTYIFQDLFPAIISGDDTVEVSVKFIKNDGCFSCLPTKDCLDLDQYPYLLEVTKFTLNSGSLGTYVCTTVNEVGSIPSESKPKDGIYYPINIQFFESIVYTCQNTPSALPTSMAVLNNIISPYDNVRSFDQITDISKMSGTTKFNDLFVGYTSYSQFFVNFKNNTDFYIHYKTILLAINDSYLNPYFQTPCPTPSPTPSPTPCPTTSKTNNTTLIIVSSILGGTCLLLILIILYLLKYNLHMSPYSHLG